MYMQYIHIYNICSISYMCYMNNFFWVRIPADQ